MCSLRSTQCCALDRRLQISMTNSILSETRHVTAPQADNRNKSNDLLRKEVQLAGSTASGRDSSADQTDVIESTDVTDGSASHVRRSNIHLSDLIVTEMVL
uniref:Uncharacterized protein n=1 Tax=Steinernema glaseri TaxID=37863 RepID=A0A1I8ARB4_9BILA